MSGEDREDAESVVGPRDVSGRGMHAALIAVALVLAVVAAHAWNTREEARHSRDGVIRAATAMQRDEAELTGLVADAARRASATSDAVQRAALNLGHDALRRADLAPQRLAAVAPDALSVPTAATYFAPGGGRVNVPVARLTLDQVTLMEVGRVLGALRQLREPGTDLAVAVLGVDITPGVNLPRPDHLRATVVIGPAWDVSDGGVPEPEAPIGGVGSAVPHRKPPRSRRVPARRKSRSSTTWWGSRCARRATVHAMASLAGCATCVVALASCAHRASRDATPGAISAPSGAPLAIADQLNREAADVMAKDPPRARALLQRALDADPFHGPAHNNMGVVHLSEGRLNEAAAAFARARRLMPSSAEPRVNLGLTFERAQRFDDAGEAYEAALAVSPHDAAAMLALTRLELRMESTTEATRGRLREIALSAEREDVREWARVQSLRLDGRESSRRVVPE